MQFAKSSMSKLSAITAARAETVGTKKKLVVEGPKGNITGLSLRFQWRIENFSRLNNKVVNYSCGFLFGSHKWKVLILPKEDNVDHFSISLLLVKPGKLLNAEFSLAVIDQIHNKYTVRKSAQHQFTERKPIYDFKSFMPRSQLNDTRRGYIVNDTCIVEVEVSVPGVMGNFVYDSKKVYSGKSMVAEPQVGVPVEVVAPAAEMVTVVATVPEPETQTELGGQRNEPVGVAEAHAEVQLEVQVSESAALVEYAAPKPDEVEASAPTMQLSEFAPAPEYPGAGQLFEEGRHFQGVLDDKFEYIGGFSILKTQASLYKQIWLKYGHIASSQVLTDMYSAQVTVVSEIMTFVINMHHLRLAEVSSEMIDSWDKKLKVAEKLEFNIRWLRECFEDVKKDFYGEQKLKTALLEQDQAKARLIVAEVQFGLAFDEMKKARENLSTLVTRISPLLLERQQYLVKGGRLLLLFDDNDKSMSPVDNNPSTTMHPTGSAKSKSSAKEAKRKLAGVDGNVGSNGEPSKKKVNRSGK